MEEKGHHRLLLLRAYFLTVINIDRSLGVKPDRNIRDVEGCANVVVEGGADGRGRQPERKNLSLNRLVCVLEEIYAVSASGRSG